MQNVVIELKSKNHKVLITKKKTTNEIEIPLLPTHYLLLQQIIIFVV